MCLSKEVSYLPCKHTYKQRFEFCQVMKERLCGVTPMLGFECPTRNSIVLETEDFCDDCAETTAGQALAMFQEMNNAQVDVVRQKLKNEKRKKRRRGSHKDDPGHLAVPAWDTKSSQRKSRQRSLSVGPYEKCSRRKTSEHASQQIGQPTSQKTSEHACQQIGQPTSQKTIKQTSQNNLHEKLRRHSLSTVDLHHSIEEIRADLYVLRYGTSASDAKPAVGHEQNVESLYGKIKTPLVRGKAGSLVLGK